MTLTEAQVVILDIILDKMELHRPICRLYCAFFSYDLQIHYPLSKSQFLQLRHRTMGPLESSGTILNDYNV